ncbi:MAG: DUF1772 domain-containing protein [Saprospiraceae bacterium]|nr:DUF1772 domain-containing protein [Saprospiraceae bacterium]
MFTQIALWATVITYTVHLAGHIFDKIAIVPNWHGGTIDEMTRNKAFFQKGHIHTFFGLAHLACFISSLITAILVQGSSGNAGLYAWAAFGLNFATSVWTIIYFVPMNKYFDAGQYDPVVLHTYVKRWTVANHLRFVLLTIALVLAILAFEAYR